jgi:hypothetical protein
MKVRAVLFALLALWLAPGPASAAAPASARYTDKHLYRDIAAEVAQGSPYYEAAARLQRTHRYPLKPGITVRLPTLTLAAVALGWSGLRILAFAVLGATTLAWLLVLRDKIGWPERLAAAALIASSGGMLMGDPMIIHERWAGLLLGLALALRLGWREAWPWALAAAGMALAIRELALPFAVLALVFALWERRWREAAAWFTLIALFTAFVTLHLHLVAAQVRPEDLTTQGWTALGGPQTAIAAIVQTSFLQYLPKPLATLLAIAPLAGWFGLERAERRFCLALFAGYALMFALFARPDNFYWGAIVQPAWFVGIAFLPRAAIRLRRAPWRNRANLARADAPL